MKKKMLFILAIIVLSCTSTVIAGTEECAVQTVEGDMVSMTCKDTQLMPGHLVKVKVIGQGMLGDSIEATTVDGDAVTLRCDGTLIIDNSDETEEYIDGQEE